jgi:hypothetical protein
MGEDIHSGGNANANVERNQSASTFDEDEAAPEELAVKKAQFTGTSL